MGLLPLTENVAPECDPSLEDDDGCYVEEF